jgi:acyl carrier protein
VVDRDAIVNALVGFLLTDVGVAADLVTVDAPLISSGLLDSFAMLGMLAFAEQKFEVVVPAAELSQEIVDTLDAFSRYIEARLSPSATPPRTEIQPSQARAGD